MSHVMQGTNMTRGSRCRPSTQRVCKARTWRLFAKPVRTMDKPEVEAANLLELGPIGMTIGRQESTNTRQTTVEAANVLELGPIGMTISGDTAPRKGDSEASTSQSETNKIPSIHSMTTEEWRAKYEKDGAVDLWLEDEFNAGSRLIGGRAVHKGGLSGFRTGEGPSAGDVAVHKITIHDRLADKVVEVQVPEDRYILWEAEDGGLELPYACRMGCCTACAVRVKEGEVYQPEALGISAELKEQGYALMCVGFPRSDAVLEIVSEDEVYDLQFGRFFAQQAMDPENEETVERDDYALEIAMYDE